MGEPYSHIGQLLKPLKAAKRSEEVTICDGRVQNGTQLVDRISALSFGLRKQLGLKCGQRVAIAALNSEWYLEWLLAVPSAGGIIAPLNHRWSVEEASEAIREINATGLVLDEHCLGWLPALKAESSSLAWVAFLGKPSGLGKVDSVISPVIDAEFIIQSHGPDPELQLFFAPKSVALICFTSGTTGRPKGVCLSHAALLVQCRAKISVVGYCTTDVYLHTASLCHIGGISSALATVMANGCHLILPKFQPAKVFECIHMHGVSTMIVVPAMISDMISHWHSTLRLGSGWDGSKIFPTVTKILNGAGRLYPSQLDDVKTVFPAARIFSAYGMTEACSSMTFLLMHSPQLKFGENVGTKDGIAVASLVNNGDEGTNFHPGGVCVGWPPPHVEIQIKSQANALCNRVVSISSNLTATRKTENQIMPRILPGIVMTRGAHVMEGYWEQPLQTRDALHPDGWLDTGDLGWLDDAGRLWLLGRQKDVIKSGGENVYASEVEAILAKHPAVLAVATVGLPDARLEEVVAALVRIGPEWKWQQGEITIEAKLMGRIITETLLKGHCRRLGLSRYKIPKVIMLQEDPLPVTSTGKVRKDEVRSLILRQLEVRSALKHGASFATERSNLSAQQTFQSRL